MSRTTLPGFDAPTRQTYRGSMAVVPYTGERHCSHCSFGVVVRLGPFTQDALFYHGGYGSSESVTVDLCTACGHVKRSIVATARPPRR